MFVLKRDGRKEQVKFEKISKRISVACKGLKQVDPYAVAQKVIQGLYDGVSTRELDHLAFETAYAMSVKHPEYDTLATRLSISNLHKETSSTFVEVIEKLYQAVDSLGNHKPLIAENVYMFVKKYGHVLDSTIDYSRDYLFDYFGFKTLERAYLLSIFEKNKDNKLVRKIVERPQHMWMRVAIGIHTDDVQAAINTYHMLSTKQATHATPTLFNAGLVKNQLSSCFVAGTRVFTFNYGLKNIEDVKVGDIVLTHLGNIKPVEQIHKNPLNGRKIYEIKTYKLPVIKMTYDHEFWSLTQIQITQEQEPQWNSIETLQEGDWIALGALNKEKSHSNLEIMDLFVDPINKKNMSAYDDLYVRHFNGKAFIQITKKEIASTTPKFVYTLGVKDDHSYVVEGLVAKNCFLIAMKEDSIKGIYDTLSECALISQSSGGIGVHCHNIRSKNSPIYGTGGMSNGIVPMLRNFNETARYVDQCFEGDTEVMTSNGWKMIADINKNNDQVKTCDNQYHQILSKKQFNYEGQLIEVAVGDKSIKCTPQHLFLVAESDDMDDPELVIRKIKDGLVELKWIEASKLLNTDLIVSIGE